MSAVVEAGARTSGEESFGVAVVGVGRWGKNFVRVLGERDGVHLRHVCDVDPARLEPSRGSARRSTDARDVFADSRVHGVVLSTPPSTHTELTIAALRAGKHVLVEKPMALGARDAKRIVDASRLYRRRVMVGYVMQYHPQIETLARWIASGTLGEIRRIAAHRGGPRQGHADPGPWWSLAPHDVNLALTWLGESPVEVTAAALDGGSGVRARFTFDGGTTAELVAETTSAARIRELYVVGSRATARFDGASPDGALTLHGLDRSEPPIAASVPGASMSTMEPLKAELLHFVERIRTDEPFRTEAVDGARVVEVLERVHLLVDPSATAHTPRRPRPEGRVGVDVSGTGPRSSPCAKDA
jgi:predicted dehydrogenase